MATTRLALAGVGVIGAGVATAALYFGIDEENAPQERVTAAKQRDGDSLNTGGFQLAELQDGATCYRIFGFETNKDAPVIVFIHGATIPSAAFSPLARIAALSGFRCLTYDRLGVGYSDRPPSSQIKEGMSLFTRQLYGLLHHLRLSPANGVKVVLLGLSMGGAVCAHFAASHPEMITGIVAGCPLLQHLGRKFQLVKRIANPPLPSFLLRKWQSFVFRRVLLPKLISRAQSIIETGARDAGPINYAKGAEYMVKSFDVKGSEACFLGMFVPSPRTPGSHAGGDLLWSCWESILSTALPIGFLYAEDDEDIPLEDSERLRDLLQKRSATRSATVTVVAATGGHGFFVKEEYLEKTFAIIGKMVYGEGYEFKFDRRDVLSKLADEAVSAGL